MIYSRRQTLIVPVICIALFFLMPIAGHVQAKEFELPEFNPANYVLLIDNLYMPLIPGTTFVYEAETEDESIVNEIEVTYDTKVILGVVCTVVYDVEWVNGVISEETYDWYAQDMDGNVWYFGEDTTEYLYDENGVFLGISKEGSWEAGVDGATAGIVMLADPEEGLSYQQEYYEDEAEDMGKVLRTDVYVSIEYGDFEECLKTKEWTALDPGTVEHKYYAPGVGLIFIKELKEKTVLVELVDIY